MAQLSAFADEVASDFIEQIKFLDTENVRFLEIRFLNRKNIMDLSKPELKETKQILNDHGIGISAIGSPIGKVKLDEPFEPHLDKFKYAVELADFFETPFIRMFSYYPPDGQNINDYADEVFERMQKKVELINDTNVTMVHENETGIFGHSAENCVSLIEAINSPKLRLVFDSGNFVWGQKIVDSIESCWPLMKPYTVHIHIKDWNLGSEDIGAMPGEGDGQIKKLLTELAKMNYDGYVTLEPHLRSGGQFGGDTGPELFSRAIEAVRNMSEDAGLKLD